MQVDTKPHPAGLLLAGTCFLTIIAVVFWPLHSAGMTGDDWSILARVVHQANPLPFVLNDHSQTYLYRPVAMSFWWLTGKLFAANTSAQYAASVALHLINSGLLYVLARSCGVRRPLALAVSGLFALHPVSAATTAWLSDRFDLLATGFTLGTLVSLARTPPGGSARWALPLLLAFLAMACKETAVILLPAVSVWAWIVTPRFKDRAAIIAAVSLSAASFILLRWRALGTWGGGTLTGSPIDVAMGIFDGFGHWLAHAGHVVLGIPGSSSFAAGIAFCLLLVVALFAAFWLGYQQMNRTALACFLACCTLIACAGIAQAPVTRLVLSATDPFGIATNLRFYYLALASFALAWALVANALLDRKASKRTAAPTQGGRHTAGHLLAFAVIAIAAILLAQESHQMTTQWARETAEASRIRMQRAAADAVLSVQPAPACIISLYGTAPTAHEFPFFSDSIIKAQLPESSPLLDCIVLTEQSPYLAFTSLHAGEGFAGLAERRSAIERSGPYVSGGLLVWLPGDIDRCEWSQRGKISSFLWNGSAFVSLQPDEDPLLESCALHSTMH